MDSQMNAFFNNINNNMKKFQNECDKIHKKTWGKYIKGNFLIKMKYYVLDNYQSELNKYYDFRATLEKTISNSNDNIEHDLCRMITGVHFSNTIFLPDEKRVELEKDSQYQLQLAKNVLENIKLRNYGSRFFRNVSIVQCEPFIACNVPYNMFVLSMKILSLKSIKDSIYADFYYMIAEKSLAILTLLENAFFANCYPICRVIIELFLKLILFKKYPGAIEEYKKFTQFEVEQSACQIGYPDEFNCLFLNRKNQKSKRKSDYLHYGWADMIPQYHDTVNKHPYTASGIFEFFFADCADVERGTFEDLKIYYSKCHGYAHGNVMGAKYPVLHYFEISSMLQAIVLNTYIILCEELGLDMTINGVDIVAKVDRDYEVLAEQFQKCNRENFEAHYKRLLG